MITKDSSFVQKFIDEWIVASVAPIKKKNL